MSKRGESICRQWLIDRAGHQGDECLIWPFSRTRGYGYFRLLRKGCYAHRFMCELKHGPAPSDIHEAAHNCGNNGCVNPEHLRWKTPTENMLDCRLHGTHVRSRHGNMGRVTPEQAAEIRALKGLKKLREIAEQYSVSESTVSNIWVGRTHLKPKNLPPRWSEREDSILRYNIGRGLKHKAVAQVMGRPTAAISSRAKRLRIGSPSRAKNSMALTPAQRTES